MILNWYQVEINKVFTINLNSYSRYNVFMNSDSISCCSKCHLQILLKMTSDIHTKEEIFVVKNKTFESVSVDSIYNITICYSVLEVMIFSL